MSVWYFVRLLRFAGIVPEADDSVSPRPRAEDVRDIRHGAAEGEALFGRIGVEAIADCATGPGGSFCEEGF